MNRLLEPIQIRGLHVRNRVVMPPMTTRLGAPDYTVTERLAAYYEARARGGVGLITVELSSPDPRGRHRRGEVGAYDDRFLPGLTMLAERIKRQGGSATIQLGHAGAHACPEVTGEQALAPSDVPHSVQEVSVRAIRPRPMSQPEIHAVVDAYAKAAGRMKRAGFDAITLQGAHDYLLAEFLSPFDNRRADEYGGDLRRRARFALEVVEACRGTVGDMPIIFRMNASDYAEGGVRVEDACQLARLLESAGVDLLDVSAGCFRSQPAWVTIAPMAFPPGMFVPLIKRVKESVRIPAIAVGRLNDPAVAEAVLTSGSADMVAIGRGLIADPEWVRKVQEGRQDEIRPCLACNTCHYEMRSGRPLACVVNPAAGEECADVSRPVSRPLRVMVVGGGPAGLTAATILAERGHRVTLHEQADGVGGALRLAAFAPHFQEVECSPATITGFIEYLERMSRKRGVEIRLNSHVGPSEVAQAQPDALVIALGAPYRRPWRWPITVLLRTGLARRWPLSWISAQSSMRELLLCRLRTLNLALAREMEASGRNVFIVGDCKNPRGAMESIRDAWRVANELI